MKFSRFLQPGSVELLNLRIKLKADGCPHCQCPCAMVSHGYLQAISKENTKGLRLFCSNRYSNQGCGRTIQVYWNTVIPGFMWQTSMILALVRVVASGPSIHGAWYFSGLKISLSSAYRWMSKWGKLTAHIRAGLCRVVPPPGKADSLPDPFTLNHLDSAFPQASCVIAAFQLGLQSAITG